jgi:hypothetical protein
VTKKVVKKAHYDGGDKEKPKPKSVSRETVRVKKERRDPVAWTQEEMDALLGGVEKHGESNWVRILQDDDFSEYVC